MDSLDFKSVYKIVDYLGTNNSLTALGLVQYRTAYYCILGLYLESIPMLKSSERE